MKSNVVGCGFLPLFLLLSRECRAFGEAIEKRGRGRESL